MSHKNIDTISIVGMHRSGTSCLTGMLSELGFYCGSKTNQFAPDKNNKTGYFEDKSIIDCNETLLEMEYKVFVNNNNIYSDISQYTRYKYGWIYGPWTSLFDYTLENEKLLINTAIDDFIVDMKNDDILTIKDPRLSLNLQRWEKYLNIKAAIVIVRHPEDVILSLHRRDGLSPRLATDMYYLYNHQAFKSVQNIPHLCIVYEDLINKPVIVLEQIISFFNLNNINIKNPSLDAKNIIDNKLNHQKRGIIKLDNEILNIYKSLKQGKLPTNNKGYYTINNIKKRLIDAQVEIQLRCENASLMSKLNSLNIHPLFGQLIKLIRLLKNDTSFANEKEL